MSHLMEWPRRGGFLGRLLVVLFVDISSVGQLTSLLGRMQFVQCRGDRTAVASVVSTIYLHSDFMWNLS